MRRIIKLDNDTLWQKIRDSLQPKIGDELPLLYPRKNSKKFRILKINDNGLTIQFIGGKNSSLYLNKSRFFSAYNFLKEKQDEWLYLGSSKNESREKSIEYRIKMEYNGKENSTATAAWVCTLLVDVFDDDIEVDRESEYQEIRLIQ